jgi:hypothetical protein
MKERKEEKGREEKREDMCSGIRCNSYIRKNGKEKGFMNYNSNSVTKYPDSIHTLDSDEKLS